jgi:hypothetical protein
MVPWFDSELRVPLAASIECGFLNSTPKPMWLRFGLITAGAGKT